MNAAEDNEQEGESMSRCLKEDLTHSFEVVLKDLPEVLLYIKRLNEHIKKQQCTLVKLFEKLKEYKQSSSLNLKNGSVLVDVSTQTDTPTEHLAHNNILEQAGEASSDNQISEWATSSDTKSAISLADEVKKVAESAMQQTGFVYEETSGMYYDYNTGYYYNAEMGLYYDGNSGTYLYYNERTKSYEYHSHAATPVQLIPDQQMMEPAIPFVAMTAKSSQVPFTSIADIKIKSFNVRSEVKQNSFCSEIEVNKKSIVSEKEIKTPSVSSEKETKKKQISSEKETKKKEKKSSKLDKEPRRKSTSSDKGSKKKSKSTPLLIPDPLETKETELQMSGSNPMAPVDPEVLDILSSRESREELKSPKESRNEHKRKGKHKKHKSKKKKKKRHRSHSRSENSMEEGECSLSSESDTENTDSSVKKVTIEENEEMQEIPSAIDTTVDAPDLNIEQPWKKLRRLSEEASEAWPPCMRIIVESTEVRNLNVGNLFIVTCKGGTLGREKFHAVCIPDINISKHHGVFTFDESSGKYFFTDYGSRNGTYVSKQRLSAAKQESDPCEIPHGTVITLGSTNLLCHIHPGRETCEECEPGVVASRKADEYEPAPIPSHTGESKSEKRMQELRRLRKRFGIGSSESKAELAPGYEDRAEIRRVTVGSHNEHAKTEVASTTESIRSTNKGFKMLSKMGWKEGESLGKGGTGLTEPVLVTQRAEKAGLGADNAFSAGPAPQPKQRADRWQRARERYGQLPDTVDDDLELDE
ncbi:angiogenic factor with G patch and FHA domains 1 isoform X1 [Frankliniella occidentalis]|uniref:Angiogenic factor with G patch and FHA domains 1 isoform X1 n=1 Tax=Frankliniella occidentalis TaxID=133901 RepID=A0A6J1SWP5_FRAOC|nr:angiogenic factor with G patch and FHA domains 1 isoform X1 [Frankliniella occidentalis]